MSQLTYNGITLPYGNTSSFVQKNVYDPEAQTDWCLTEYAISSQGMINSNYLAVLAPDLANSGTDAGIDDLGTPENGGRVVVYFTTRAELAAE